jgi:transcriptional regulator with PAS, ATPase and Fis domain
MEELSLKTNSPDAIPQMLNLRPGTTLGRSRDSTMVLHDETVSREHCVFKIQQGEWLLVNLSELNRTQLNGQDISEKSIKPGDCITCGGIDLKIVESECEAPTSSAVVQKDLTRTLPRTQALKTNKSSGRVSSDVFVKLLDSNQELLASESMEQLLNTLFLQLHDLFGPEYIWVAHGASGEDTTLDKGRPIPISSEFKELLRYSREKDQSVSVIENGSITLVSAAEDDDGIQIVLQCKSTESVSDEILLDVLNCISTMCNQIGLKLFADSVEAAPQEAVFEEISNDLILIGSDESVRALKGHIKRTARSDAHVLIQGETGVGKEIVSKLLHAYSPRKIEPLKIINCAAIPTELFESEMFGHEKDAFTGATTSRTGAFESADKGTLILDEITELSVDQQAKLLRAIEYGTIQRIGQDEPIKVDVRIIAITNKDIVDLVKRGEFRSDLYHRMTVSALSILPLRERKEDIVPLVKYFVFRSNLTHRKSILGLTDAAIDALMAYDWPGNVRELKNVIDQAVTQSNSETIGANQLALGTIPSPAANSTAPNLPITSLKEMEATYAKYVYDYCEGDVDRAAGLLGIGVSTLYKKIR